MHRIVLESYNLRDAEAAIVLHALKHSKNMREAARILDVTPRKLKRIITRLEIGWDFPAVEAKGSAVRSAPSILPAPPIEISPTAESLTPDDVSPSQEFPTVRMAGRAFSWLATLIPRRIWNEDVGDALEVIAAMERAGCSTVKIWSKVLATLFWALYTALRGR